MTTPYRQNQIDFISRYAGRRTVEWIAERLRVKPVTVRVIMWEEGIAPTLRDDLLTTGHVADILGYSQQWVLRLWKRGRLRGWRNPGGRWLLIPREEVQSFLARQGRTSDDPRLTDELAWPRVIVRRGRPKGGVRGLRAGGGARARYGGTRDGGMGP